MGVGDPSSTIGGVIVPEVVVVVVLPSLPPVPLRRVSIGVSGGGFLIKLPAPAVPSKRLSSCDFVMQVFAPLSSETQSVFVSTCVAKISDNPFVASASQVPI